MNTASHSKCPTASPVVAPDPARPMKCSLEMLVANSDVPIANQPTLRSARKYSVDDRLRRVNEKPMPKIRTKYAAEHHEIEAGHASADCTARS